MENKNGFIYYQRVQDDSVPYHLKEIQISDIDTSRPTIIEFTGSGALEARAVNGYLKTTESQLLTYCKDLDVKDVNIIGVDYNATAGDFVQLVPIAVDNSMDFIDNFLVPLSLDENGNLNVLKACKNLRNITFKTHCMGHEIVYYLNKNYKKKLLELGYSEENASIIMSQILEISYGSEYVPLDFKQAIIVSQNDREVRDRFYSLDALFSNLDNIDMSTEDRAMLNQIHNEKDNDKMTDFFKENERVYIIINNENELVFCFSNPVDNKGDDHSIHFARIEKNNTKAKRATDVGFYVAKGISSLLYGSIKNSLLNAQTQNLIPLDLNELGVLANEVVKPLNDKPLAKYSQKGE